MIAHKKILLLSLSLFIFSFSLTQQKEIIDSKPVDWQSVLFRGVISSDVKKVENALAHGADVNVRYGNTKKTLLIMAMEDVIEPYKLIDDIYDPNTERENLKRCGISLIIAALFFHLHSRESEYVLSKSHWSTFDFMSPVFVAYAFYIWFTDKACLHGLSCFKFTKMVKENLILYWLRYEQKIKIIEMLIEHETTDVGASDLSGITALSIARKYFKDEKDLSFNRTNLYPIIRITHLLEEKSVKLSE